MLARVQQDVAWDRTTLLLRLRSLLREDYPAMVAAAAGFEDGLKVPRNRWSGWVMAQSALSVRLPLPAGSARAVGRLRCGPRFAVDCCRDEWKRGARRGAE